jgi:hypothetical protein
MARGSSTHYERVLRRDGGCGEALIIAEVEQMAKAAETPQEQEILFVA